MNVSNQITELITIPDILHKYGIHEGTHNRTQCPIHNGKDKNFCYTNKVYHCWVCGAKGNAVSLVAQMFGLDNTQAAIKINNDFNLNLYDRKPTYRDKLRVRQIEAERAARNAKAERGQGILNHLLSLRCELFQEHGDGIAQVEYLDRLIDRYEEDPAALVDCVLDIENLEINLKGCADNDMPNQSPAVRSCEEAANS